MKTETTETFAVAPLWVFCRVATDDGLAGWASRSSKDAPPLCRRRSKRSVTR